MGVQVVWFKQDLRVTDHAPLFEASRRGPILCLFVYDPAVVASPSFDAADLRFLNRSLEALDAALAERGARLALRAGPMPAVLDALAQEVAIDGLWSHEETGDARARARDEAVRAWAAARGVPWHERAQSGVVRRLATRDGWEEGWEARMAEPLAPTPRGLVSPEGVLLEGLRDAASLGLAPTAKPELFVGGEPAARALLGSFLARRGETYWKSLTSPVSAREACSRLGPYLRWGNLSLREVHQASRARRAALAAARAEGWWVPPGWEPSLLAFEQRLRWRSHFMQKLEDEPSIEFANLCPAYDGLREGPRDAAQRERLDAWREGRTGYPLVDAAMRALVAEGWLNFRLRAVLVSFAVHHLWLDWRPVAAHLARHFLDFEPGVHYPQVQMQAGTTGTGPIRIFSPARQLREHDPEGRFIARWVPELAPLPACYRAEPHDTPPLLQLAHGCVIGRDYPAPIVGHREAVSHARERLLAVRATPEAQEQAAWVLVKHGSRWKPAPRTTPPGRTGGRADGRTDGRAPRGA